MRRASLLLQYPELKEICTALWTMRKTADSEIWTMRFADLVRRLYCLIVRPDKASSISCKAGTLCFIVRSDAPLCLPFAMSCIALFCCGSGSPALSSAVVNMSSHPSQTFSEAKSKRNEKPSQVCLV